MFMVCRIPNIPRLIRFIVTSLILWSLVITDSYPATPEKATEVVEEVIHTVNHMLYNNFPKAEIYAGIEEMFINMADTQYIGQVALGRQWLEISEQRRNLFLKIFQRYLAEKYSIYFPRFIGADYEVIRARTTRNDQTYEIVTTMYLPHEPPFPVYWDLVSIDGEPRIRNITVDDLNLLVLERKVIGALLEQSGGNLEELMRKLKFRYQ